MLVSDDFYMITFGALECKFDSYLDDIDSLQTHNFTRHRKFIQEESSFRNIFQIEDPLILSKIQTNYRLFYLRDNAIGRFIEENTLKNINIIIHYLNNEIVQYFSQNKQFLVLLCMKIENHNLEEKLEGISFLLELTQLSRDLV